MGSTARHLSIGLALGMSATALIAVGAFISAGGAGAFAPARTATPSNTPIVAMSLTPTLSPTPAPTATFTSVPTLASGQLPAALLPEAPTYTPDPVLSTINSGGLIFTGPLSNAQQAALYRTSLKYIRTTPADSRRLAKQINAVGYGDPSNICGPLAIALLQDAGLMTTNITPHDFWLLDPLSTAGAQLLGKAFPLEKYAYSRNTTPINKINWRDAPLVPGDFLFVWHGSGGNFDHMLVVTRVDSDLRTYAVTNYGTSDGYVISEAMLYDPNDPSVGLFHLWTKERLAILGATGFGGFELWRRLQP